MKQAVMSAPGVIEYRNVPVPAPGDEDVLVKIQRIGVCGSDVHVYHGKHPYTSYPVVQGHEVSGIVEAVGSEVTGIKPGDKVTIQPQVVCGTCYQCRTGRYNVCESLKVMGFQTTGAASEYFCVHVEKIHYIPESLNLDTAALTEPLAVAVHAIRRYGNIQNKKVLVLGAGTIGNLTAQAAKAFGAETVMITDLSDFRLTLASSCGIDYPVNPKELDLAGEVQKVFSPDKMDVIFEAVGVQPTIDQAITLSRKGGDIIIIGVFGEKPEVDLGLLQDRELQITGTLMYLEDDYKTAIRLLSENKIQTDTLITTRFKFDDYIQAYKFIENAGDEAMKVIIDL
ncbi:MAG: zinc-dependent alcohol dehydrogenase [Spirochaetia bacterium]